MQTLHVYLFNITILYVLRVDNISVSIHPPRVGRDVWPRTVRCPVRCFNPPSPCGEGRPLAGSVAWWENVSIHPPRVGRDLFPYLRKHAGIGFNPPSPCGEGLKINPWTWLARSFNPPSPCGEGRREGPCCRRGSGFQSTLPVWGGTPPRARGGTDYPVSIHPPRVGRDGFRKGVDRDGRRVSIHPPRVGRDTSRAGSGCYPRCFNPPSPCGEGRCAQGSYFVRHLGFNPPSPCGEGPDYGTGNTGLPGFNPPSPCGEGQHPVPKRCCRWSFQSTLPVWGGTPVTWC